MQGSTRILLKRIARGVVLVMCAAAICNLAACNKTEGLGPPMTDPATIPTQAIEPQPEPSDTTQQSGLALDPSKEPPLDAAALSIAVPDFLTAEQQDLYRRAYCIYNLFCLESAAVEDFPLKDGTIRCTENTGRVEINGIEYCKSSGRYQKWDDFVALVESVFTPQLFQKLNTYSEEKVIFQNNEGTLCYLDLSNVADDRLFNKEEFKLVTQSDSEIQFYVIGDYANYISGYDEPLESDVQPGDDFTKAFSCTLLKTQAGWRFSEYSQPS